MFAIACRQAIDLFVQGRRRTIVKRALLLRDEAVTLQPRQRSLHRRFRREQMARQRPNIKSKAGTIAQEQQRFKLRNGIDGFDDEFSYVVGKWIGSHSKRHEAAAGYRDPNMPSDRPRNDAVAADRASQTQFSFRMLGVHLPELII